MVQLRIEGLENDEATSWLALSLSHRIRLLPLLLGERGFLEKAIRYAEEFEQKYLSQDQLIPNYTIFRNYILERYNA